MPTPSGLPLPASRPVSRRAFAAGLAGAAAGAALAGCTSIHADPSAIVSGSPGSSSAHPATGPATSASPAEVAARATVPVLCYHQVRNWTSQDSAYTRENLVIPPDRFGAHLDAIASAGYTTISPGEYFDHLTQGAALPSKPVLITFDDGKDNQASALVPALTQRGMKGTIFIMTVVIGNPGWVTKDDIKRMADAGMTIGSHTWDHHRVDQLTQADLERQLTGPRETLAAISGQPVLDFAYPYGAWNENGAALVRQAGYRTGYQLMDKAVSSTAPLYSLRRQLAVSTWSGAELVAKLGDFAHPAR